MCVLAAEVVALVEDLRDADERNQYLRDQSDRLRVGLELRHEDRWLDTYNAALPAALREAIPEHESTSDALDDAHELAIECAELLHGPFNPKALCSACVPEQATKAGPVDNSEAPVVVENPAKTAET